MCFRGDVPTHHVPDGGFWVYRYCSEASTNHEATTDDPVLGRADPEPESLQVISVLYHIETYDDIGGVLETETERNSV